MKATVPSFRPIIYGFEALSVVTFVLAILILRLAGLGITWWSIRFTLQEAIPGVILYLSAGVILQILYRKLRKMPVREYARALLTRERLLLSIRILFSVVLLFYSYTWLKLAVPLINWRLWDLEFWRLDRAVHGGISPTLFITALFPNPHFLRFIDSFYGLWLYIALGSQGFFFAFTENTPCNRYVFSMVMVWTLGVWLYIAFPALGPVYVFPQLWPNIRTAMPSAGGTQEQLWLNYQKVLQSRKTGIIKAPFNPSFGIAAMPSLHVGILFILFLWAKDLWRPLALFYAMATLLTFLGSVVTGWHYAVDSYAGMFIAYFSYRAALLTGGRKTAD